MPKMRNGISETRLIKSANSDTEERATAHLKTIFKIIKMKMKKTIAAVFALMLLLALCLTTTNSFSQTKTKSAMMKDCCMMKDGKMMVMKDGKTMPMEKDMIDGRRMYYEGRKKDDDEGRRLHGNEWENV
jgi:hypothetical protein